MKETSLLQANLNELNSLIIKLKWVGVKLDNKEKLAIYYIPCKICGGLIMHLRNSVDLSFYSAIYAFTHQTIL